MDFDLNVVLQLMNKLREAREVLERHRAVDWSKLAADIEQQYVVEHALFLAIQTMLDICAHVISAAGAGVPAEYADMPRTLASLRVIPTELAERLAKAARFRNRLIHNYRRIDLEIVYRALQEDLEDFDQFDLHVSHLITKLGEEGSSQ